MKNPKFQEPRFGSGTACPIYNQNIPIIVVQLYKKRSHVTLLPKLKVAHVMIFMRGYFNYRSHFKERKYYL